jgi:hypothetical protein
MGTVAGITGWFPVDTEAGEVFLFLGLSFAAQNAIVAHRTIARSHTPGGALRQAPRAIKRRSGAR